ncbi:hypothetical protein D3C84_927870 [compost metagenome]
MHGAPGFQLHSQGLTYLNVQLCRIECEQALATLGPLALGNGEILHEPLEGSSEDRVCRRFNAPNQT